MMNKPFTTGECLVMLFLLAAIPFVAGMTVQTVLDRAGEQTYAHEYCAFYECWGDDCRCAETKNASVRWEQMLPTCDDDLMRCNHR